ncbi:exosortase [Nostoc sphaeroides CCNUC1]|uniref:Exosortase n=1 Tax=Nostoc sphaeroides CCNUC1 TaxID=2653204 RepID=A0A5P8WC64_9NOSO|nr:exosortase [Nostoc sphaeroides CCNUC1]
MDDSEAILTDIFSVSKPTGLNSLTAGLADAFLQDVATAGGGLQIVYEDAQVEDVGFTTGNGYGVIRIPFPLSLNAVPNTWSLD